MARKKRGSKLKMTLLVLLLAILCIGGVELAVCRVMDPALFERITEPVLSKIRRGQEELFAVGERVFERIEAQEPPEEQRVAEPELHPSNDIADESLTKLENRDGAEMLTGGNYDIVYYNQTDPSWSEQPYGTDNIGGYGCGPTALAMAVSSMSETRIHPADMAKWARSHRYWAKGHGSYLSIVEGTAAAFGLRSESLPDIDVARLQQELASGKILVALMTKGHFTKGGHFILLRGVTLEGGILVADPSSRDRSLTVWDPQLILNELSYSRHNGAPLWSLSAAELLEG